MHESLGPTRADRFGDHVRLLRFTCLSAGGPVPPHLTQKRHSISVDISVPALRSALLSGVLVLGRTRLADWQAPTLDQWYLSDGAQPPDCQSPRINSASRS